MRKQILIHYSLNTNLNECTATTFVSDTPCPYSGSHLSYPSGTHTFTNVDFTHCSSSDDHGGAIKCTGGDTELTVTGCTFRECHTSTSLSKRGGGVNVDAVKIVTIKACLFVECSGYYGGGLCINDTQSTPSLSDCVFFSCKAHYLGGEAFVGLCTKSASTIACNDCIFIKGNNVSLSTYLRGGGFYLDIYENTHANAISNNLFTGNSVNNRGGGLAIFQENTGLSYSIQFCFFTDNFASDNGQDVYLQRINVNSILHCFATSNALDRLYTTISVTQTS